MAAKEQIENPSKNPNGERPERRRGLRQIRYLQIPILSALLCVFLWTKFAPSAQTPRLPQELPKGLGNCYADHFNDIPDLAGTKRLTITAKPVLDDTAQHPGPEWTRKTPYFRQDISNLSFCSVTYRYTHIGYDNQVNVTIYLPRTHEWNGRFQGVGGGGFVTGLGSIILRPAVAAGWAAASTDGGFFALDDPRSQDMSYWALNPGGNINWNSLHIFGIRAIEDMTRIGQAVTKRYFNTTSSTDPLRSYWNGCSTGGRQGLMLAQRAPHLYDGILATAPALDYSPLVVGMSHAQQLMMSHNVFPQPCELSHIHALAISECDPLDDVTDGLISSPELCKFDPLSLIDTPIPCADAPGGTTTISAFAAHLVREVWRGPRLPTAPDVPLHPGLPPESPLGPLAGTVCNYSSTTGPPKCTGVPSSLITSFLNVIMHLNRDPDLLPLPHPSSSSAAAAAAAPRTFPNLTEAQYHALLPLSSRDLSPLISAADPNLSRFATAPKRPKMITWHGMADELITPGHSLDYYRAVMQHFKEHAGEYTSSSNGASNRTNPKEETEPNNASPPLPPPPTQRQTSLRRQQHRQQKAKDKKDKIENVQDFYRYYQAPGVQHCGQGVGPYPGMILDSRGALDALVDWVESGTVPEVLDGVSEIREDLLVQKKKEEEEEDRRPWDGRIRRPLCTWPNRAVWKGEGKSGKEGDWWEAEGWECVEVS